MKTTHSTTFSLTLVALFAALMAIGANITAWLPFMRVGEVPITLQTFFSVMAGVLLGKNRGALAMLLYLMIGLFGLPVFAGFLGGPGIIVQPTFGFILSFVLSSWLAGYWVEKHQATLYHYIIATVGGCLIQYILGTHLMYLSLLTIAEAPAGFSYAVTWLWMLPPFPKDIILSVAAAFIAIRVHQAIPALLNRHSEGV
ncbi:biotin transporter BioY [Bacillaceae bacterium SIJ1]|uniref:biotin transporter BioY n=1 Tax=Litoribacterium kuwaitense TaxID=1398745 RepID=UPI0013ECE558|nr:biotin transporter BioY [Litoribacterium kuwaitense]NGP46623.1 biotin transporter BioY [Litoribacterium kuwaitense]